MRISSAKGAEIERSREQEIETGKAQRHEE
jgi:hypothetical protein